MGTIVQEYGPIYGEAVNGTVQGRPNGSVYVPISNVIVGSIKPEYHYVKLTDDKTLYNICNSSGVSSLSGTYAYTAQAQDLSSNVQIELYEDSLLTTLVGKIQIVAGKFNGSQISIFHLEDLSEGVDTVYIVSKLMNNNVPVATSDTIALGVVS